MRHLLMALFGPSRVEYDDFDHPLDVWSFRARERLKVHEARTAAELGSRVEQPARVVGVRWWQSPRRVA